jgi:hypothetical protein
MKTSLRLLRLLVAAAAILSLAAFVFAMPASATHGQPGKQLQFQLMQTGSGIIELAPGFPFERSTFGGRCSVPSDALSWWNFTGTATHLGWFTAEASHCSQLDLATGVGTFSDGVYMATTANGDAFTYEYDNGLTQLQPDGTGTYTAELTITGGTGRFAGVTGEIIEAGGTVLELDTTVMPWTATVAETLDGWIAYDASQVSGQ